jgi:hypothetical protein
MRIEHEPWISVDEDCPRKVLVPRSPWNSKLAQLLMSERISGLRLSYSAGFRGESIAFVADFPFLRTIEVFSFEVRDLSPISHLLHLEVLGLETKTANGLHVSSTTLRVAKFRWCKGLEPLLATSTLEYLNVVNYPYVDLTPLCGLTRLRRLAMTSRKLENLNGVRQLRSLDNLDLHACPNLVSIDDARAHSSISRLEVESCRHISKVRLVESRNA